MQCFWPNFLGIETCVYFFILFQCKSDVLFLFLTKNGEPGGSTAYQTKTNKNAQSQFKVYTVRLSLRLSLDILSCSIQS